MLQPVSPGTQTSSFDQTLVMDLLLWVGEERGTGSLACGCRVSSLLPTVTIVFQSEKLIMFGGRVSLVRERENVGFVKEEEYV